MWAHAAGDGQAYAAAYLGQKRLLRHLISTTRTFAVNADTLDLSARGRVLAVLWDPGS